MSLAAGTARLSVEPCRLIAETVLACFIGNLEVLLREAVQICFVKDEM